jgi:peptidylprolyl isomerase
MPAAKNGDTVRVHYTGKLKDGTVFDTSRDRDPIEFKIGDGGIIPGFEKMVLGMEVGDTKTEKIRADDAYGSRRDDRIITVGRDQVPDGIKPKVSQQVQLKGQDGSAIPATIIGVTESDVTIDANHPLAGYDLTFSIELVEIL